MDLLDMRDLPNSRKTDKHWRRMGHHHAQAAIARVVRRNQTGLPMDQHNAYFCGLLAGARRLWLDYRHERAYWEGYIGEIDLILDLQRAEQRIGLRAS